jgi:hypothetical protein
MSASDGLLGCSGSDPGKLIYLLGEPRHVPLQKLPLGDFEAASTDRDHAMVIANWRAVGVANYLLKNWSRFSLGLVASYLDLGDGIGLDLGDGNRLGLVVQVVIAASQRYDFVLRLIASAYGMQTASTRSTWVFEVEFLCRFCK